MISASHNPPEYNGIKIFDNKGKKIKKDFEDKIQTILNTNANKLIEKKEITLTANKNFLKSIFRV